MTQSQYDDPTRKEGDVEREDDPLRDGPPPPEKTTQETGETIEYSSGPPDRNKTVQESPD